MISHRARELLAILRDFKGYLGWERERGLLGLRVLRTEDLGVRMVNEGAEEQSSFSSCAPDLEKVRMRLDDCRRCKLWEHRKNIVFGSGNEKADLVFVGEGPGAEEDEAGEPFVGRAGQLLTRIIESIGLKRDQVYICNIIKCRPPQNRNPQPDEIEACEPFLSAQLQAIAPKLICTLGTFATQTLLQSSAPISALRGQFHAHRGIPLLPTFHPAYLLRNPPEKKKVWEDMKMLKQEYDKLQNLSS
jgi:uracil-DNA glycosylase